MASPQFQPPWPPTDPTAPLPFDQRGCCWPWGPDGPVTKLPMRYDVIGDNPDHDVHPDWGRFATGQMVLASDVFTTLTHLACLGATVPADGIDSAEAQLSAPDGGTWAFSFVGVLTVVPFQFIAASGSLFVGSTTTPFDIPVTGLAGPLPAPEWLTITPLRWWQSALYPYLGP